MNHRGHDHPHGAAPDGALADVVIARLDAVEQRYTAKRRELVEILSRAPRPLTIPEVLDEGDGLAQSSVYRNLVVLESAGVVRRLVTDGDFARYELAEDLTGHHHHLICGQCGSIEDFTVPEAIEGELERLSAGIAADRGFTVESHRLDLVGRCARCDGADGARSRSASGSG